MTVKIWVVDLVHKKTEELKALLTNMDVLNKWEQEMIILEG